VVRKWRRDSPGNHAVVFVVVVVVVFVFVVVVVFWFP